MKVANRVTLSMDEVATLLGLAALADLDPDKTEPSVMALVYKARTVVDTSESGRVAIRSVAIQVRR